MQLGILALVFLLLFLNFTSNFLLYAARSSKRAAVAAHLAEAGQAVLRLMAERGAEGATGEGQSEIMRRFRLESLWILPAAPESRAVEDRRRWLAAVADRFPPDRVPGIVRQVVAGKPGRLNRGEGAEYFLLQAAPGPGGAKLLLVSRREPELARLDDVYRLALVMSLIALVATAAVYVILARLIFAPFRKAKEEARTAGRTVDESDDDVEVLLNDYRRMIAELREKERELLRLNLEISRRAGSLEQFNRYLLASMPSGIVTVDRAGRIQTINAAAERILGLREGEARGRFHAELMPRELAEAIAGPLVDEAGGEYREVTPAGLPDTPVLGIAASTVWDGEGEPIGAALLINDATEITQLREQLERRLRLAALGEMSGGLAHQLRNSLGAIAGYLNLLKRRLGKRGVEEPAVAELADEAAQAESLVRRFLEFARPLQADLQAVPLRDLIGQAAASFATREAYPRVEIAVGEIPEVVIPADPLLLRQALLNLIENAANAYSGAAGKIEIDAAAGNGETAIRVRDRACGIAPENVAKIFTPFYSSRPSGTGLGLALVSKIVDLHKGRIEVDSRVGRGSTFTITLPVGAPQPAAAEGPAEMRVRG